MPKKIKIKAKKTQNPDAAFQHYQWGNLQQAETICRQILSNKPDNSDAWHLLGMIALRGRRNNIAIQHISKAIQLNPNKHSYYHDLGLSFMIDGAQDEAIKYFSKTLELKPDHAESHFQTGFILQQYNRLEEAAKSYEQAIMLQPDNAEAHNNIGLVFLKQNKIEAAITSFKRALALEPDYAEAYYDLGNALWEKGSLDEAIDNYKKALMVKPDYALAWNNLGIVFADKDMISEAIEYYKRALMIKPDYVEAYNNIGRALADKNLFDEAIENYKKALELDPGYAEAHNNLGIALIETDMLDEAIDNYKKALLLKPDYAEAYNNLGAVLSEKNMLDEAIENHKKALMISPDYVHAHTNLATTYILIKDFGKGWKEYEWRHLDSDVRSAPFPQPHWDGSPLGGRTLIVTAEQGVGDEIMFASCLPDVFSQGGNCVLECDKRLMPLFSRSFSEVKVIPRLSADNPEQTRFPQADIKIAIGSLPLYFRPDLASFPQQGSYLIPDEQKVEKWRARFKEAGEGLKVGISWQGGKKEKVRRIRSIPLERWSILFDTRGIHFINLQYGDCAEEIQELKEKTGITVHDWEDADPLKDLDGFAAQIAALDLVVSVDNSTVHMAGALGVPVWAMLPLVSDWRWLQDVEDTPWYESVRLYRQSALGEWDSVLNRVVSDLEEYVTTGVIPEIDKKYSYKKTG